MTLRLLCCIDWSLGRKPGTLKLGILRNLIKVLFAKTWAEWREIKKG
jgi:hypothetical protein